MRLLRIVWRLFTLLFVVAATYVTAFVFLPYLDHRLPVVWAILLAYLVLAYVLLPLVSRFWRLVFKPNHIPLYVVTSDGWPADPVNIAVIARNKRHLVRAMRRAGWHLADKRTLRTTLLWLRAFLFNQEYPTAPFTPLYLFGRSFDLGFQKPRGARAIPHSRHHVRFWRLHVTHADPRHHEHASFWREVLSFITHRPTTVWIGAAIDDTGPVGIHWRNLQLTHQNDANTNRERDLIITDLTAAGLIRKTHTLRSGDPFTFYGQTIGNRFMCDGQLKVIALRPTWRARPKRGANARETIS